MLSNASARVGLVIKALAIPASLAAVVAALGFSGACPLCESVTGRFSGSAFAAPPAASETPPPPAQPTPPSATPAPESPEPPAIAGTMWDRLYLDLNGKPVDLADHAGKPMVIELWATWCGPCIRQREHMHQLSAEFPDVAFVAASVDQGGAGKVRIFLAEKKSPKTSKVIEVLATPELQAKLNQLNASRSIPKVAYVNRKGQLVEVAIGTQKPDFMKAMVRNLTKAK